MEIKGILFCLVASCLCSVIIYAIIRQQFEKFLDAIGESKYYKEKEIYLLNQKQDTPETKLLEKYLNKILLYTMLFLFIIFIYLNSKYGIF